ncbi:DUF418 domain-containing protein [Pendulispora brunnea]|uniref:DUF418 domain-containing protein n=1 Tax=Pendulispora brunnea TaxID=2905690 RepID=A0ABZ2K0W5_9BACT
MADLAPVPRSEREPLLDVLRALALCVVVTDNVMTTFSGSSFLPKTSPDYIHNEGLSGMLFRLLMGLRSMTVMSFLFGLGFSIQLTRAKDSEVTAMYLRRLTGMFALGMCHIALVWWGDILWIYALAGLVLLPCRKASTRTLIGIGLALAILPRAIPLIPFVGTALVPDETAIRQMKESMLAAIYGTEHGPMFTAHLRTLFYVHVCNLPWFLPWLAGRFILGFVAGRHRIFENNGANHLPLFRKLAIGGAFVALLGGAVRITLMGREMAPELKFVVRLVDDTAVVASVAMGISLVVLLMQNARWQRWLSVLIPVGRTPLTTYLSQSVIATFLFYGWGLGLARHVQGPKAGLVGLAIFMVQIAIAGAWLRRYELGPLEWVWRTLAYGKRQPMRRQPRSLEQVV